MWRKGLDKARVEAETHWETCTNRQEKVVVWPRDRGEERSGWVGLRLEVEQEGHGEWKWGLRTREFRRRRIPGFLT